MARGGRGDHRRPAAGAALVAVLGGRRGCADAPGRARAVPLPASAPDRVRSDACGRTADVRRRRLLVGRPGVAARVTGGAARRPPIGGRRLLVGWG